MAKFRLHFIINWNIFNIFGIFSILKVFKLFHFETIPESKFLFFLILELKITIFQKYLLSANLVTLSYMSY